MTTAVIIGYIALFAVAIQTGIIMIVFIRQALARKAANETYVDAVIDGSVMRLRPKLMTVAATTDLPSPRHGVDTDRASRS